MEAETVKAQQPEWQKWKRKRKCLEAALFREVKAEAEVVMKKLMEAEAVKKKSKEAEAEAIKKLPLPDTLVKACVFFRNQFFYF